MAESDSTPEVRPCAKCGTSDRYKDGRCKQCSRDSCVGGLAMKSWLILVSHRGREPIWYGNIDGKTRDDAKRNARLFVSSRLTDDAKIVRIAEGKMTITFTGPDTAFDD